MIIQPKSRLLIIRHGESLGQVDRENHVKYPDNALPLSTLGQQQARQVGKFINAFFLQPEILEEHRLLVEQRKRQIEAHSKVLLEYPLLIEAFPKMAIPPKELPDKPKVRLWFSPFKRTVETKEGLLRNAKEVITDERENPYIYEILFGLNDGLPDGKELPDMPAATKHYRHYAEGGGRHFVPMLLGESRSHVELRVRPFKDAIRRDIEEDNIYNHVVVTHGLTSRILAKVMMKYSIEEFEKEKNPGNCWVRYIEGLRREDRKDHGWIYTAEEKQIKDLESRVVRTR